jgi:lysozyme
MIVSDNAIELIKDFESLRLEAYLCPANVWTIGYGHTRAVKSGDVITLSQAERLLRADLVQIEKDINQLVRVPLTQGQFDALVSFVFNCGTRAFSTSTLLKKLNNRDYSGAANELERWRFAKGRSLAGLERRRRLEKRLFLS